MRTLFAALALLAIAGCTTGLHVTNYTGADAGYLVASLGAQPGTRYNGYNLFYRRKDRSPEGNGKIWWGQASILEGRELDSESEAGTGIVDVRRMPPGDYEIFNFSLFYNAGNVQKFFSSKQEFSIPFSIRPGSTTYIGEYLVAGLFGRNIFGMPIAGGGYFIISNKSERDIAVAKRKQPALGPVQSAVVDARIVGNPLIRAAALPKAP
jgi:hypothetical protein